MSLWLMDRTSQMQRPPWQDPHSPRLTSSEHRPLDRRQIPGIATALDRPLPMVADHRLPPIATTFDSRVARPQDHTASVELGSITSSRPTSPFRSPDVRPEKRPRWHWSQDTTPILSAQTDSLTYKQEDDRQRDIRQSTWSRADQPQVSSQRETACSSCANTGELVARIVSRLQSLEQDIRYALALSEADQINTSGEITKFGLRQSLLWACDDIQAKSHVMRQAAASRTGNKLLAAEVANDTPYQGLEPGNFNEQHLKRRADCLDDQTPYSTLSAIQEQPSGPLNNNPSHSSSTHPFDTMKRTYQVEPPPVRPAQSPHGSPPSSTFGTTTSPSRAQSQPSNRTLPSPSAFAYPSSASSVPSSYGEGALSMAQTSHLQDLQHQISTKTLALQTLQREHDQLLAAFSRSQIRCSTLDKKSQVSDHEINTLSEDKARLQQQVETLETQVEELGRARDEAQQQSAADGAQWQRIMAMSSQLQIRSAEETRQFRSEKEAWDRDRDGLQRRIQEFEAGKLTVGPNYPSALATPISSDDILASTSLDTLREEILRLRRSCAEMESLLRDIQGETQRMGPSLATLTNTHERISAISSKSRPSDTMTASASESGRKLGDGG